MNSMGDKESPCLTPRLWVMRRPGCPLTRMRDVAVDNSVAIHLCHCSLNPNACSIFSRKGHAKVSNAFEMSNLSSKDGIFLFLMNTAAR
jgi:hypothetical protein